MRNLKDLTMTIQRHFDRQPPLKFGDADTVLDALFWLCSEFHNPDGEKIRAQFEKLRAHLILPPQEFDAVFDIVSDLCIIQGRTDFTTGIRLGMLLMQACLEPVDV